MKDDVYLDVCNSVKGQDGVVYEEARITHTEWDWSRESGNNNQVFRGAAVTVKEEIYHVKQMTATALTEST